MLKAAGSCGPLRLLLVVLCVLRGFRVVSGATDPQDATGLQSLMSQWQNFPPNWGQSNDPCGQPWDGVNCSSSRVTTLKLSTMGIKGTLSSDIALLSELQTLDLSYNNELGGTLPPNIGNLKNLKTLILAGCNFTGPIPETLGNPPLLSYIALNSNKFTGTIPASLGKLSNINWLDLAENRLTGTIPVSSSTNPGLDLLFSAKHFHFNKNQLTGSIPRQIFNSKMTLIHILFDGNQLTGEIPETVGLVSTLEVLRLDKNQLNGSIPSSIRNLTLVNELNLANNQLQGVIPDLTGMNKLNYLDLSNNSFDVSDFPDWVTNLRNLTTIVLESARLGGNLPANLLNIPQLQQVILKNNSLNGTLDLTDATSNQLQLIDLQNNNISFITQGSSTRFTLILYGNPICVSPAPNTRYCLLQQQMGPAYSTSLASCASNSCPAGQSVAPYNCDCSYPYTGLMVFRAPSFSDLTNKSRFQQLESSLWTTLGLAPNSVSLQNLMFNSDGYLQLQLSLFQYGSMFFTRPEILRFGFYLSNQTYKPPADFGPYFFIGSPYPFEGISAGKKSSLSTGAVAGIALGCSVLLIALIVVGVYAFRQKKRAERAIEITHPFASWVPSGTDAGGAPQLKGARFFTFDEVKKCTSSFSEAKEIGAGGYGKVYKGTLPSGQTVAIKRAEQGSLQGALEFKTEIELLSRVHHKNLVGLVGFCFEQGEQMLVYEFVSNGTLRENLVGKVGIQLDWKRRLRIAVGSARGLAYLHDLADPPIIHRDIKSSNILLDENLTAKVADFGLSKLVADSEKGHISTQVKGTLGYLDPEYYMTQQLTDRSDVYSFGVVMLELITSKLPIEKGKYIVREIRTAIDRNDEEYYGLREIIDPVIRNSQLVGFKRFLELALRCVQESATERPRMNEVVKELETILQDEGSNPASTFSSATDFGNGDGGHRHPYVDQLPSGTPSSDPFDNSMGYAFLTNIEPK